MKISNFISFFLLLFITSCSPVVFREEAFAPTPEVESLNLVTNEDIDFAQHFAESIFSDDQWERSLTTQHDRVMSTWIKADSGNLAYLDYRIYSDGYTQEDLDWYYSDESFSEVLYSNYENVQKTTSCTDGALALYEFDASYEGTPYLIRDWVDTSNPTRIADLSIIFTLADENELHAYAKAVFPSLPSCP